MGHHLILPFLVSVGGGRHGELTENEIGVVQNQERAFSSLDRSCLHLLDVFRSRIFTERAKIFWMRPQMGDHVMTSQRQKPKIHDF